MQYCYLNYLSYLEVWLPQDKKVKIKGNLLTCQYIDLVIEMAIKPKIFLLSFTKTDKLYYEAKNVCGFFNK